MRYIQIKAIRKGTKPPVWRRILLPAGITFAQAAVILETALELPLTDQYEFEFYHEGDRLIEWDRRKGDFSLKYNARYDSLVLKGSLLEKGDTYVFVLTNLRNGSEAVPNVKSLGLTVVIDRHDAAPGIPGNYTEITKMDKREFKHFTEDITDGLQELWDEYFE